MCVSVYSFAWRGFNVGSVEALVGVYGVDVTFAASEDVLEGAAPTDVKFTTTVRDLHGCRYRLNRL